MHDMYDDFQFRNVTLLEVLFGIYLMKIVWKMCTFKFSVAEATLHSIHKCPSVRLSVTIILHLLIP